MLSESVAAELLVDPFQPLALRLVDGSVIDIPTPYLSFIQRRALYVACAARRDFRARPRRGTDSPSGHCRVRAPSSRVGTRVTPLARAKRGGRRDDPSAPSDYHSHMPAKKDSLRDDLDRKVNELRRLLPRAARSASIDAVHQARVATRRLKAALDLLKPILPAKRRKEAARTLRRVRRALGPVRDHDVMLARLRDLRNQPGTSALVKRLEHHLRDQRTQLTHAAQKRLFKHAAPSPDSSNAFAAVWPQPEELEQAGHTLFRQALPGQLESFAHSADAFARSNPPGAGAGHDVHALRIAGKLLRYTLEMAGPIGLPPPKPVLRAFKPLQEALGLWHDEVVLGERALQLALDEQLSATDPLLFGEALRFANASWKRGQRHLMKFAALWKSHGGMIVSTLRDRLAEPANEAAEPVQPPPPAAASEAPTNDAPLTDLQTLELPSPAITDPQITLSDGEAEK